MHTFKRSLRNARSLLIALVLLLGGGGLGAIAPVAAHAASAITVTYELAGVHQDVGVVVIDDTTGPLTFDPSRQTYRGSELVDRTASGGPIGAGTVLRYSSSSFGLRSSRCRFSTSVRSVARVTTRVPGVRRGFARAPEGKAGSIRVDGEPSGRKMGYVRARRGHMTLLPAGAAYQFCAETPGVILLQTLAGDDTIYKWADICQTM